MGQGWGTPLCLVVQGESKAELQEEPVLHSTAGCRSMVCIVACIQLWHSLGCLGTNWVGMDGALQRAHSQLGAFSIPLHCSCWMLSCLVILVPAAASLGLCQDLGSKGDTVLVSQRGMSHQRSDLGTATCRTASPIRMGDVRSQMWHTKWAKG